MIIPHPFVPKCVKVCLSVENNCVSLPKILIILWETRPRYMWHAISTVTM